MGVPLELKGVGIFGEAQDDPLDLQEVPDFFENFRDTAELAGVAGGFSHVEKLRRETANVNQRAAAIYKGIAAAAADKTETKPLSKGAPLKMFAAFTKRDEERRLIFGVAAAEVADRQGEILDYESSKPFFEAWSASVAKDTGGASLGNVRAMHQMSAAGVLKEIKFDDNAKQIEVCAKIVDDDAWKKVKEGAYCGFSIGGRYVKTWPDGQLTRYTADLSEVSLVDRPAIPTATFVVKTEVIGA
jgi:hypothetical protein